MTVGMLIIAYFFTIPFMIETDTLGRLTNGHPKAVDVVRLKHFFSSRACYWYLGLMLLLIALEFFPWKSDEESKRHYVSMELAVLVLSFQGLIWGLIIRENLRRKRSNKDGD
jgi:hypothetical protein